VHRTKFVGEPADRFGQPGIRGDGVGPLGVAAERWDDLSSEYRGGGRVDGRGDVGVPVRFVESATAPVPLLEPVPEDRVDGGIVRVGDGVEQRMCRCGCTERRGEPQVGIVVDELVAEKHHLPLQ
jgi:hypothetical protein